MKFELILTHDTNNFDIQKPFQDDFFLVMAALKTRLIETTKTVKLGYSVTSEGKVPAEYREASDLALKSFNDEIGHILDMLGRFEQVIGLEGGLDYAMGTTVNAAHDVYNDVNAFFKNAA